MAYVLSFCGDTCRLTVHFCTVRSSASSAFHLLFRSLSVTCVRSLISSDCDLYTHEWQNVSFFVFFSQQRLCASQNWTLCRWLCMSGTTSSTSSATCLFIDHEISTGVALTRTIALTYRYGGIRMINQKFAEKSILRRMKVTEENRKK